MCECNADLEKPGPWCSSPCRRRQLRAWSGFLSGLGRWLTALCHLMSKAEPDQATLQSLLPLRQTSGSGGHPLPPLQ